MQIKRSGAFAAFLAIAGAVVVVATPVPASASVSGTPAKVSQDKKGKTEKKRTNEKGTKYAVVRVDTSYEVTPANELNALKKKVDAEYQAALKKWNAAKKAAQKSKEKFSEPKPAKKSVKVIGNFPSKEAAEAQVAKLSGKDKPAGGESKKGKDGEKDDEKKQGDG